MNGAASRFRLGLSAYCLAAACAAASAGQSNPAPGDASKPALQITEWDCAFEGTRVKIAWAARSNRANLSIGGFGVRVDERPEGFTVPGTVMASGHMYFRNPASAPGAGVWNIILQTDNGALDLDKREGRYAVHIDTKGYKPGRYAFQVFVTTRPAAGTYADAARGLVFEIAADGSPRIPQALAGAENSILYMREGSYACFPSMTARPDGKWTLHFSTKTTNEHINPEGGSRALLSDDEGRTWTPTDEPEIDRMMLTRDGAKLVKVIAEGWIYVPESERARLAGETRWISEVNPGRIAYLGGAVKVVSPDGGKTWTKDKIALPDDISGLMNHSYAAMSMTAKEGVRMTALYGRRIVADAGGNKKLGKDEVFILRSGDDGETWECIPVLPRAPDSEKKELGFNETAIAQAGDDSVFLMMRTTDESNMWTSRSTDLGKTWSSPSDTGLKGYPADMITLADGRVLCVYGYRSAPMGIRAAFSGDGGRTWSKPVVLRDDGAGSPSDLGYPMALQRADGKIFTVYYLTTDGQNTHIAASVWDPAATP